MISFLLTVVLTACFTAFTIRFLTKTGIREKVQVYGNKFFSEMFRCDFCMSFWSGVIVSVITAICFCNISLLLVPVFSTPISCKLL